MSTAVRLGGGRAALEQREYEAVREFIYRESGIELGPGKQTLVYSRLLGRLEALGLDSFQAYVARLDTPGFEDERQTAIDLLCTNETYFNREPQHFKVLQDVARRLAGKRVLQVWSAACSSGEEIFTIAMVLQALVDGGLPLNYELMGSDLSTRMLELARRGVYPESRVSQLPQELLRRYGLKGQGPAAGTMLVAPALRQKVRWRQLNLIEPLPEIGPFDVIFLRNVLIYFDRPTKQKVLEALARKLRPDGLLIVGLSDGVLGLTDSLRNVGPGVLTPKLN